MKKSASAPMTTRTTMISTNPSNWAPPHQGPYPWTCEASRARPNGPRSGEKRFHRPDDVHSADAGVIEHLGGFAGARHLAHRQVPVVQVAETLLGERGQNGVADPALHPVVLHHDDATPRRACRV